MNTERLRLTYRMIQPESQTRNSAQANGQPLAVGAPEWDAFDPDKEIGRALAVLEALPGYDRWLAQYSTGIQEAVRRVPPNIYYSHRKGPFPAQIVGYGEDNQIVTVKAFVHSPRTPRVQFGVRPIDLRPYRELPPGWQICMEAKWPPLYDLRQLPPDAFEPGSVPRDPHFERWSRLQRRPPEVDFLRELRRAASWL